MAREGQLRRRIPGPRTVVCGLLLALVGAEVYLSTRHNLIPERVAEAHERFGFRLRPATTHAGHGVNETTNALGFRDREWQAPGTAEVGLRVAVLGNSVAYGVGVSVEETWPRVLESLLDEARGGAGDTLVMNFAVPGYVVEQMARVYDDVVRGYRPDVLILSLGPYSIRPMRSAHWIGRMPLSRWLGKLSIVQYLERKLGQPEQTIPGGVTRAIRTDPNQAAITDLWAAAENRLAGLVATARADGTRVVVVSAPMLSDVLKPERSSRRWEEWAAEMGAGVSLVRSGPPLREAMSGLLEEMDRSGVDSYTVWQRRKGDVPKVELQRLNEAAFFRADPLHLTPAGHEALAGALAKALAGERGREE